MRVRVRGEHTIRRAGTQVWQYCVTDPRIGIVGHFIGQRPEQVPPGDFLAEQYLVASRLVTAGATQRLRQQAAQARRQCAIEAEAAVLSDGYHAFEAEMSCLPA